MSHTGESLAAELGEGWVEQGRHNALISGKGQMDVWARRRDDHLIEMRATAMINIEVVAATPDEASAAVRARLETARDHINATLKALEVGHENSQ